MSASSQPCLRALRVAVGRDMSLSPAGVQGPAWGIWWHPAWDAGALRWPSGGLTPGLLSRDPEEVANGINAAFSPQQICPFCLCV